MCVAVLDINHFSDINDGLGQEAGNELLKAIAGRLESSFGDEVKKSRIGGDVFALIGPEDNVNPDTINQLFASSFHAGDHTLPITATVGFCRLNKNIVAGIELLKRTNIALNRAKKTTSDHFEYYEPDFEKKNDSATGYDPSSAE